MAGGMGTRLKSVTGDTPKPLAKLVGKPILEHILTLLKNNGITEVCLSLRYGAETIINNFGSGERFGIAIKYNIESTPLGTAGGVKACERFMGGRDFLVISGDCACDFDLRALFEAHHRHNACVTIALAQNSSPLQYGTVLVNSKDEIVSFTEKPSWNKVVSDLVNTGIYVVSPRAMGYVPKDKPFDFSKDLFPKILSDNEKIIGVQMDGYWCDIGTPREYYKCNLDALDGKLKIELPENAEKAKPCETGHFFEGATFKFACSDRARLMRAISQNLMEAGADFSDGITLDTSEGKVHIAPSGTESAINITAQSKIAADDERILERYKQLAEQLSKQTQ